MTRYLSQALGAAEPVFSQSIQQLEQAGGLPSEDIRLTTDIQQRMREKIMQLGLDPKDTTGPELYNALLLRMEQDDAKVREVLSIPDNASTDDILGRITQVLHKMQVPRQCFVLKSSVAKRLLKKKVPKIAMKQLGYRSVDSMLKHEPVAQLYAAALITESSTWHKAFREQYSKLHPSDFEMRTISVFHPTNKRWDKLSKQFVSTRHHNIIAFKELGTMVVLPMHDMVDGLTITSFLLGLQTMNDIRSYSSYVKLQQVRPDFGKVMMQAAYAEPHIDARLAGQTVRWQTIHRYFAHEADKHQSQLFEPHVQADDLVWTSAESIMARLAPTFIFWQDTQDLALLHDGEPVSCNILDTALNYCNKLSFSDRVVHFVRDNMWHSLMVRYLNQQNLETALESQLTRALTGDLTLAE